MLPSSWPRWTLVVLSIAIAFIVVLLGLLVEPLLVIGEEGAHEELGRSDEVLVRYEEIYGKSGARVSYTMPGLSDGCQECHFSLEALQASADEPATAETYLIEDHSILTPHGRLGCLACHDGNGMTDDKDEAHAGLIRDLSEEQPEQCWICHHDLPEEVPGDRLKVPHKIVEGQIAHGEAVDVWCSECHGEVGHGFDPVSHEVVCTMSVCTQCHIDRGLDTELNDCEDCHIGPHDIITEETLCDDCHTSLVVWDEVSFEDHDMSLEGRHGEISCFTCHDSPNFRGLQGDCVECHERPHDFGDDNCAECHKPTSFADGTLPAGMHPTPLVGAHATASCESCHSRNDLTSAMACVDCHSPVHQFGGDDCAQCHAPTEPFAETTLPAHLHPVPLIGAHETATCDACHANVTESLVYECMSCHQPPENHATHGCENCHTPEQSWTDAGGAGGAAPNILHKVQEGDNCALCHETDRVRPYPDDHAGWAIDTCQACHQVEQEITDAQHFFPQDHNGAGNNCTLCHADGNFEAYDCTMCHRLDKIEGAHEAAGVTEIENLCAFCHAQGTRPIIE